MEGNQIKKKKKKKFTCKGNIDIYNYYVKKCIDKERVPLERTPCKAIWEEMNYIIIHILMQESEEFVIPYKLGSLRVIKKKTDFIEKEMVEAKELAKKRVDWKESKKLGYRVYHNTEFIYKIQWTRPTSNNLIPHIKKYFFKPCFNLKRTLANCIKVQNIDYFPERI